VDLLKDYIPGRIENSAKMEILFCIIRESIALGDRLLVFSQSLITLDLIEQFLQMNLVPGDTQKWCRNSSYYRELSRGCGSFLLF
jgi:RAD54-like protein 2